MTEVFYNCTALKSLNISNWNMSAITYTTSGNNKTFNCKNMLSGCSSLQELRLDNCNNATINNIITSSGFPTDVIDGVTRKIYCKEENAAGLIAPTNWVFEFVE
jgi:surface protein